MFKKYFTDGLIQVAIVLSLMRTDLNDYLNNVVNNLTRENIETHDVIHGPTSAYTQASVHRNRFYHRDLNQVVHPKNIDNIISETLLSDLHALNNLRHYSIETDIAAYIVGEHGTPGLWDNSSENPLVPHGNITDHTAVLSGDDTVIATSPSDSPQEGESQSGFSELGSNPGSELTLEDMDLIDILWRQDMDMGVSKDIFMRQDLEKEDQEPKVKVEESSTEISASTELPPDLTEENVTFIVDDETGELVPAPPGTVLPSHSEDTPQPLTDNQGLLSQTLTELLTSPPPVPPAPQPGAVDLQSVADLLPPNVSHTDIEALVHNMSQLNGVTYSRQSSMEGRWQDVEGLITEDPATASQFPLHSTSNSSQFPLDNTSPLLQNASLAPASHTNNLSLAMAPPGEDLESLNLNESQMLLSLAEDMPSLFPNSSLLPPATQRHTNVTSLLSDILGEVNDLNNTQVQQEFEPVKFEETDSAVGSLSPGSSQMEFGDSRSDVTSPFEGLEGATGGSEDGSKTGVKFDPSDYQSYSSLDWDNSQLSTNSSGDQNDTDLGFTAANPRHVSHNHSYPLQPGQEPREIKSYPSSTKREALERERAEGHNRDQRRAKMLKIPFSTAEIINSPVEVFNDMLTKYKFSDAQLQLIKDIRRRGKNKVAAQNCRKRKLEVIESLDEVVQNMRRDKEAELKRRSAMERERDKLRDKYNALYRDVFRSLRDEEGRPYDPSEYTLQHTSDGSVFLMPRNQQQAAEQDPELKRGRKRKGNDRK